MKLTDDQHMVIMRTKAFIENLLTSNAREINFVRIISKFIKLACSSLESICNTSPKVPLPIVTWSGHLH